VDWGTGKVADVGDAAAGDGAYCDGCDNSITTGLVYGVVLTPYGTARPAAPTPTTAFNPGPQRMTNRCRVLD
jgi:hypothetical protein